MNRDKKPKNDAVHQGKPAAQKPSEGGHGGRKLDRSRDVDLLDAALSVLAEEGYEGMTMDMVAVRAKAGKATIYRRWSSKAELVLDAVAHMKRNQAGLEQLPDTGTLRGDLLALFKPLSDQERERRMKVMAGISSLLSQHGSLAEAGNSAMVDPWANAHRVLMLRALERGSVSRSADIDTLSRVIPTMAAHRALIQRKPFDREFLVSLVDGVVLPALGVQTIAKNRKK